MRHISELRQRMLNAPIPKLEAIYNKCWRNQHNEIEPELNLSLMNMIESVLRERDIEITGNGGAFEFKQSNPFDEPMSDILNLDTWKES